MAPIDGLPNVHTFIYLCLCNKHYEHVSVPGVKLLLTRYEYITVAASYRNGVAALLKFHICANYLTSPNRITLPCYTCNM